MKNNILKEGDKVKSVFIKEQRRYYKNELIKELELNSDEFVAFVRKLKSFGVLKMVKATPEERELSELLDTDIELANEEEDSENYFYVFTYVGILTIGNRILKCYPKYINEEQPKEKMKQVLQVLRKYNSKEQIISLYNGMAERTSFNLLAIMLYILEEYGENGVYTNEKNIVETNGSGEILWDNTINETFAVIKRNRPFYMELKTLNVDEDQMDYFRRLHNCIVTRCSEMLVKAELTELLGLNSVFVSEEKIEDFGDDEYILYRLERELDVQFIDRKKLLLKTMYTYISHRKAFEAGSGISMFGTNSFNLVWEAVCAECFKNRLNDAVNSLPLVKQNEKYVSNSKKLVEIIEKPQWRYKKSDYIVSAGKTLTPDLVSVYEHENNHYFAILDAKYYVMRLTENSVVGQPGVGDITKQYLYQRAYQEFIEEIGYDYVQNVFLVPGDIYEAEFLGTVEFDMMLQDERLVHISVIMLPAQELYKDYISGKINNTVYEMLRESLAKKVKNNTFSRRLAHYLRSFNGKLSDADKKGFNGYPELLRGNTDGKLLFDIMAPMIKPYSYNFSMFKNEDFEFDSVAY